MSEWQPIETIPHDGRPVLLLDMNNASPHPDIKIIEGIRYPFPLAGYRIVMTFSSTKNNPILRTPHDMTPTHWCDLPPPPTAGESK